MVDLDDAEHILNDLSEQSIIQDAPACVRVRNRNASCTACMDACPTGAISIEDNHLARDLDACTQCGCCANVCPTQAFATSALALLPFTQALYELSQGDATEIADATPGSAQQPAKGSGKDSAKNPAQDSAKRTLWICCEEHPLAKENPEHMIVVPCLAHLDEVHYMLAAYYEVALNLLHPPCEGCKKEPASTLVGKTRQSAQDLASQWHLSMQGALHAEDGSHPSAYPFAKERSGYSRRGFFSNVGSSLKHLGITVAETALESELHPEKPTTLAQTLTDAPGHMRTIAPKRNQVLLNILYAQAQTLAPEEIPARITSRFWGSINIDESCTGCGMCSFFCPTEALAHKGKPRYGMLGSAKATGPDHEFRCSDCIQCGLCEDTCLQHALTLSPEIATVDLFALEPRVIKRHD